MKKLLIFITCFFITGCTIKYDIKIDDELKVTESAIIYGGDELYDSYYKTSKNKVLAGILEDYQDSLNMNNYDFKLIKGVEPHVDVKKKYDNVGDYLDNSKLFNNFFDKIDYQKNGNIIKIETEGFNPSEKDNQGRFYVEKLDISITSAYKVINNNATSIDEDTNTFHYVIDKDTNDFKILLEIDSSKKFNPYLKSIVIIISLLLLIIAVWIIIFINKKKRKG